MGETKNYCISFISYYVFAIRTWVVEKVIITQTTVNVDGDDGPEIEFLKSYK